MSLKSGQRYVFLKKPKTIYNIILKGNKPLYLFFFFRKIVLKEQTLKDDDVQQRHIVESYTASLLRVNGIHLATKDSVN